jgi:NDP-sugar pyrophosphorylase family protein
MIPALVLTAGLATRLRPLSLVRAKAALPVAGQPLVMRILRWLRAAGITDVVLNLHHKPETLTRLVGDGQDLGMRVRYSWETPVLGSAGGPKRAAPILGASRFLMVNGDTLTPFDIGALVANHAQSRALVTMAAVPNVEPHKYSGLLMGSDGAMTGVAPRGSDQRSFHFFGVQVAEAAAFDTVPLGTPYESVATLYPALNAARPGSVRVFAADSVYYDIGTPLDYYDTSMAFAEREGTVPTHGSILWDDVAIGEGASVERCIVTDGVRIPPRTSWTGRIIRRLDGELAPGEQAIAGLAVSPLDFQS